MPFATRAKGLIYDKMNSIKSEDIKYLVKLAFAKVSPKFWEAPASSTGKYHPLYACGQGGLARHTLAAVHFAERSFIAYDIPERHRDMVIAALLLHDTCKSGLAFESTYTVFEHPILVRELIQPNEVSPEMYILWKDISYLIESHMGKWCTPSQKEWEKNSLRIVAAFERYYGFKCPENSVQAFVTLPTPVTPLNLLVANCDYMAADKECMLSMFDCDKQAWAGVSR